MKRNELGLYFKTLRLVRGLTKKEAARLYHISLSYLDLIEDDIKYVSISNDLKCRMSEVYNIRIKENENEIDQLNQLFNQYFNACFYSLKDEISEIYELIQKKKALIKNTLLYPKYLLIEYLHGFYLEIPIEDQEVISNILSKIFMQFESRDLQIYYLYLSMELRNVGQSEHAKNCLETALEYWNDDVIQSLLYSRLSMICSVLGKNFDSLSCALKAKALFEKTNNYIRNARCLNSIGLIYLNLGDYLESINYFNEAISCGKLINDNTITSTSYFNIVIAYLFLDDYSSAIESINKAIDYGYNKTKLYYNTAFAYWKLNQIKESKKWIKDGIYKAADLEKNDVEYKFLKLFEKMLSKPNEEITYLEKIVELTEKKNASQADFLKLYYRELIRKYKANDMYKEALECMEKNAKLYQILK